MELVLLGVAYGDVVFGGAGEEEIVCGDGELVFAVGRGQVKSRFWGALGSGFWHLAEGEVKEPRNEEHEGVFETDLSVSTPIEFLSVPEIVEEDIGELATDEQEEEVVEEFFPAE